MDHQELIKKIATAFGWKPPMEAVRSWWSDDFLTEINENDVIMVAAYAKAEMAKRGWTPFAEGTTENFSVQFFDEHGELASVQPGGGDVTEPHEYDPRCPMSEATATLAAINEALCL